MAFLPLVGIGLSALGAVGSGISAAQSASYQAQVARNNATIARQNAQYSAGATAAQTEQEGLKARQATSGTEAAEAANGLDVTSGSPADVLSSQRELGDLDTATVANRGAQQVYGYESQGQSYTAQASLDQSQVGPDILGGLLKAGGGVASNANEFGGTGGASLLSGSPSLPSQYQWMGGNPTSGAGDLSDVAVDFG